MEATPRGDEQFVAARPGTRRFFHRLGWALTLALCLSGFFGIGLFRLAPLANPLAIPATLLTAALAAAVRLPPRLTGTPMTPAVCRLLACRTTIPRLGIRGIEELLTAF
jgi:hypothetical protein